MKVQVHAADEGGCGHYRSIWPAAAAAAAGHDVELVLGGTLFMDVGQDSDGRKFVANVGHPGCDVLVLQRPLSRMLADAVPMFQSLGVAVVVELDDDFMSIHRQNAAWAGVQPSLSPEINWQHLKRAAARADMVTCTTPELARKYAPKHSWVIPNYLPDAYRSVVPNTELPEDWRLGWSGSIATHPTDLQEARGLVRVARKLGGSLHIAGTGVGVDTALGVAASAVNATGAWVSINEYPQAMAHPHIGMVPLASNTFNRAKSWLKGLEYAGAGVPFIASPSPEYLTLARMGVGRTCKKPRDWERHLRALLDPSVWEQESYSQREYVLDNLMVDQHVDEWVAAWSQALTERRAARTDARCVGVTKPGGTLLFGDGMLAGVAEHLAKELSDAAH